MQMHSDYEESFQLVDSYDMLLAIMCDHLLQTSETPENYHLDNPSRSVGQVVTVYCRNVTLAIVKCMPDFKWNTTVPSCIGKDGAENMGALIIVVWVVGGVLLFSLLVLLTIIITSRSKTACGFRRNGSPSTSVFHISGAAHRTSGSWGDNPGFSRGDERCGEWSFHRARPAERLPSYQEAILNNYIRVPARTGNASQQGAPVFIRTNAPPSYRSSQLLNPRTADEGEGNTAQPSENVGERVNAGPTQASENQNIQTNRDADVNQANNAQSTHANLAVEAQSTNPSQDVNSQSTVNSQIPGNRSTGHDQTNADSVNEPPVSTVSSREGRSVQPCAASSSSRRYAENYPQCLFQDEPPPPYPSRHSRSSVYRSLESQQRLRESSQNWRRSIHAVESRHGRNENEFRQNNNFRRSIHDSHENTAVPTMFNPNLRPHDYSNPSFPNTSALQVNNDTRYQSSTGWHYLPAHSSSNLHHTAGSACQRPGVSDSSHNSQVFPVDSSVPVISSSTSLQRYVPAVSVAGNRNMHMISSATSNGHNNQNTLYIVRNVQSSSASPYQLNPQQMGLLSHPYYQETQPLCTSTPINQSPATDRRFMPASHPSPLVILRNQHGQHIHSSQEEVIFQRLQAELEGRSVQSQEQPSLPQYLLHSKQLNPSYHQGGAPIARLDSEYL